MNKEIKLAIVGSRIYLDYHYLKQKIDEIREKYNITKIVSGGAKGTDTLAEWYADENNIQIKILRPDWTIGRHAGLLRNTDIVNYCDKLVAFQKNKSKGTQDSINKAKKQNKLLKIYTV